MQARYPGVEFSQFTGAEMIAKKYKLDKAALDAYALRSHQLAAAATKAGRFEQEILPLAARMNDGSDLGEFHTIDEGIRFGATLEGIASVKLIAEGGSVTAATASQICDGASGVMVVNERGLKMLGVKPLARIHHMSVLGHDPVIMLEAPLPATERAEAGRHADRRYRSLRGQRGVRAGPLAWLQALGADADRLNVNGGAIALGHPLGGSGTKLMTTLVHALHQRGKRYGLQTMCEGGGMANVTIVERL
jgi:acetyl-CoA C-acetyltransferase